MHIEPAPFVYTPNLGEKIQSMLEMNSYDRYAYVMCMHILVFLWITIMFCRVDCLTRHDGAIPQEEVWIKIRDKGGGSFKMSFQICNVCNPSSTQNTSVFAIFEGQSTAANLRIPLDPYLF